MHKNLVTFLLVEDDDTHAHLVSRSMSKSRVANKVDRVRDGAEALEYLKRHGKFSGISLPDVILLDLKLPKIDGHEVLESVKTDPLLMKIPVVVMTTSDAESDRARAYKHHANSYVVKPVDFEKFRQLVGDLCLYWGVWNESPDTD